MWVAVVVSLVSCVVAQAPGDGSELCVSATIDGMVNPFYNDPSSYADNERVLMDSWNYAALLQGSDPPWQSVDNDDNNERDGVRSVVTEVSVSLWPLNFL